MLECFGQAVRVYESRPLIGSIHFCVSLIRVFLRVSRPFAFSLNGRLASIYLCLLAHVSNLVIGIDLLKITNLASNISYYYQGIHYDHRIWL